MHLTHGETLRNALDALGFEPGAELRALERRILQHDPSLIRAGRTDKAVARLPTPAIGHLRHDDRLHTPSPTSQHNWGGCDSWCSREPAAAGKTRLAIELPRTMGTLFAGGAAFVERRSYAVTLRSSPASSHMPSISPRRPEVCAQAALVGQLSETGSCFS